MVKLSVDCEIQKETPGCDDFRDFISIRIASIITEILGFIGSCSGIAQNLKV